jgi:hypothetical protein
VEDIDFHILDNDNLNISEFLLARDEEEGIFIFGIDELVKEFSNSNFKSCDGTFKTAPNMFYQVLICLALVGRVYVTCMFAAMPRKTQKCYERVFSMLKDKRVTLKCIIDCAGHTFMTNFEVALRQAIKTVFPLVNLLGCFFHFSQVRLYCQSQARLKPKRCLGGLIFTLNK